MADLIARFPASGIARPEDFVRSPLFDQRDLSFEDVDQLIGAVVIMQQTRGTSRGKFNLTDTDLRQTYRVA